MDQQLSEVMLGLNGEVLKAVARKLGVARGLTRKADIAAALERHLNGNLPSYVKALSPAERAFLAEAAHGGGAVDPKAFSARYGTQCFAGVRWVRPRDAYPLLLLLFEDEDRVRVPRELAGRLKDLLPKPAPLEIEVMEKLPETYTPPAHDWRRRGGGRPVRVHEGERVVFQELRRVLGLVQAGKLKVAPKSGRPTDAATRLVSGALIVPDFDLEDPDAAKERWYEPAGACRAHAWGVLVQQCGWARARGAGLVLTDIGKKVAGGATPEAFKAGLERFLRDDSFDELNRIPNIRGQSGKARRSMTRPSSRKDQVRLAVLEWPVGRWATFDAAFRFQRAAGHSLAVSRRTYDLYFCSSDYGRLYDGSSADLERQYMRALLMESLGTLGVVDLAYVYPHGLWPEFDDCWGTDDLGFCGRYDGLLYVRLNRLGAYCLGLAEGYDAAPERRALFKVLPNLDLAATGAEIGPAERAMLEMFAERGGERVFRLDAARILAHLESGGSMDDVTGFLEANADGGVPGPVREFLAGVARKASAVRRVDEAILVEFADAETAALVACDPRARASCVRAGERSVAVLKKSERAFRTALKRMGLVLPPGA